MAIIIEKPGPTAHSTIPRKNLVFVGRGSFETGEEGNSSPEYYCACKVSTDRQFLGLPCCREYWSY
jgi:hypothetical protein